jgi:hypothetical protein
MAQILPTASPTDVTFMQQHMPSITKTMLPRLMQTKQVHAAAGPVNTVAPAVTGTVTVGQVQTCSPGTWLNSPTLAYQWRRGKPDGRIDIIGAAASTYTLVAADSGFEILCVVTGTVAGSAISARSNVVFPP